MPTKNPRINFTLDESLAGLLTHLAKQADQSISGLAKELVMEALERREDLSLSALAELRDIRKAKRVKHKDAWK